MTLNHEAFEDVVTKGRYYGVTTGRVANRIRDGKFTVDGKVRCLSRFSGSLAFAESVAFSAQLCDVM